MAVVINHLDAPMTILGVKLSTIGLIIGSLIFGALFDSFFIGVLVLACIYLIKKIIARFPRFHFARLIYRSIPTRSSIWGKSLETMIESHKEEFCK